MLSDTLRSRVLVVFAAFVLLAPLARSQVVLRREVIVPTGLSFALGLAATPGDPTRMAVVQKGGLVRMVRLDTRTLLPDPYLSVANVVTDSERGLLGLAFHPGYATNRCFFIYYIRQGPTTIETVVARGQRDPANPDVATGVLEDVLVLPNAASFHQAGWIHFGPDGYLYIGIGDNIDFSTPQNINTLRSKILRLDVDGPDNIPGNADDDGFPADPSKLYTIPQSNPFVNAPGEDEIWVYGMRNPWRCSFDRLTGDLWIGDVGAETREEITMVPAGTSGWNLGWACREGNSILLGCAPAAPYLPPVLDFGFGGSLPIGSQAQGGFRFVIGGYVYRGASMPCLRGTYIFGDGASGIYSIKLVNGSVTNFIDRRPETFSFRPTAFGESLDGELYMVNGGDPAFYKLSFDSHVGPDCDGDGLPDACTISLGWATDTNNNGIPDRCEGICNDLDFNNDGLFPDTGDVDDFLAVFGGSPCPTEHCDSVDINNDGLFPDTLDVESFLSLFAGGPCL